jgi:hypothetical protein
MTIEYAWAWMAIKDQFLADVGAGFPKQQGKLGKKAAKRDPRNLRMARYVNISTIPEPPAIVDNARGIKDWGMMKNDLLGCCTIAALGHAFQTAVISHIDQGSPVGVDPPDDVIIESKYEQWCGYNPSDPSTDQGGVMGDVLNSLRASEFANRKIKAFVSVDPTDLHMLQIACWLFNGLYAGVQMPIAWQGEQVWDAARGEDGYPGSWGGHCLAPGTRVLTSDLRWQPIESISIGQELLGFTENTIKNRRWYCPSTVIQTSELDLPCYDLEFSDGTKVRCSSDHMWLRGYPCGESAKWIKTEDMVVDGRRVSHICKPLETWPNTNSWALGYLAAAFDGEGYLARSRNRLHKLGFCQRNNEMLSTVESSLRSLGFKFRKGRQRKNGIGKQDCVYINVQRKAQMVRLLGQSRPPRLLSKFDPLMLRMMDSPVKVKLVSKRECGVQRVIALGTSTRTFIAEGLASHNCIWIPKSQPGSKNPISWGSNYTITDDGFSYVDEVFALLMEDEIPPKGFDFDMLLSDLAVVTVR